MKSVIELNLIKLFSIIVSKTETQLRLEYTELTWKYDFPIELENQLERHYVENSSLYDSEIIKVIAMIVIMDEDVEFHVLENVLNSHSAKHD